MLNDIVQIGAFKMKDTESSPSTAYEIRQKCLIEYTGPDVKELTLPASVNSFGAGALDGCPSLEKLIMRIPYGSAAGAGLPGINDKPISNSVKEVECNIETCGSIYIAASLPVLFPSIETVRIIPKMKDASEVFASVSLTKNCFRSKKALTYIFEKTNVYSYDQGYFDYVPIPEGIRFVVPNVEMSRLEVSERVRQIMQWINDPLHGGEELDNRIVEYIRAKGRYLLEAMSKENIRVLVNTYTDRGHAFTQKMYRTLIEEFKDDIETKSNLIKAFNTHFDSEKMQKSESRKKMRALLNPDCAANMSNSWKWETAEVDNVRGVRITSCKIAPVYDQYGNIVTPAPETIEIPQTICGKRVVAIGDLVFSHTAATHIVVPPSVLAFGAGGFQNYNIESVDIQGKPKMLSPNLFQKSRIKGIDIPDSVTRICSSCFDRTGLCKVSLPQSLCIIDDQAFSNTRLESIEIPDGVTAIGMRAFSGTSLKTCKLPKKIVFIPDLLFEGCSDLESVIMPDYVCGIGTGAFCRTTSLKKLVLPNGLARIGDNAFIGSGIEDLVFPNSLRYIGVNAFKNSSLRHVKLGDVVVEKSAFACTNSLEDAYLESSYLDSDVFCGCKSLKTVTAPNVNVMRNTCFYHSSVESIVLGMVIHIDHHAFIGCKNLKTIAVKAGSDTDELERALKEGNLNVDVRSY